MIVVWETSVSIDGKLNWSLVLVQELTYTKGTRWVKPNGHTHFRKFTIDVLFNAKNQSFQSQESKIPFEMTTSVLSESGGQN